jgi:hypothetical protein
LPPRTPSTSRGGSREQRRDVRLLDPRNLILLGGDVTDEQRLERRQTVPGRHQILNDALSGVAFHALIPRADDEGLDAAGRRLIKKAGENIGEGRPLLVVLVTDPQADGGAGVGEPALGIIVDDVPAVKFRQALANGHVVPVVILRLSPGRSPTRPLPDT